MRKDGFGGAINAADVDIERPLPAVLVEINGAAHLGDTDVVVQDIDPPKRCDSSLNSSRHCGEICDVGRNAQCPIALAYDDCGRLLGGLCYPVDGYDGGTFPCICHGGSFAIAPARP